MAMNKPVYPNDYPKGIHNDLYDIEEMSTEQMDAIRGIIDWLWTLDSDKVHYENFKRLAGYAGTGKSICITYLLTYRKELFPDWLLNRDIGVATYTWKAALVLQERGIPNACSIHSLFYDRNKDNEKDSESSDLLSFSPRTPESIRTSLSFIIIDEASMVGADIRKDLFNIGLPILFVGDAGQLPPIGESVADNGKYFMEDSEFYLTEIRRQALDNPIIALSLLIRQGKRIPYGNFQGKNKVYVLRQEELTDRILLAADQILCGRNKTRIGVNNKIRSLKGYDISRYPVEGEKLIGLNNLPNKSVFNGQQWICEGDYSNHMRGDDKFRTSMKLSNGIERRVLNSLVVGTDGVVADWLRGEAFDKGFYIMDFGYAITVHKAQGSSFPKVVVFNEKLSDVKTHRKWLYTAVTRASSKLIIVS